MFTKNTKIENLKEWDKIHIFKYFLLYPNKLPFTLKTPAITQVTQPCNLELVLAIWLALDNKKCTGSSFLGKSFSTQSPSGLFNHLSLVKGSQPWSRGARPLGLGREGGLQRAETQLTRDIACTMSMKQTSVVLNPWDVGVVYCRLMT